MTAPSIALVQAAVAEEFGVSIAMLTGATQTQGVVVPRHVAIVLARELTGQSLKVIGRAFGGRDHTTVSHAVYTFPDRVARDGVLAARVQRVKAKIGAGAAQSMTEAVLRRALAELEHRLIDMARREPERLLGALEAIARAAPHPKAARDVKPGTSWAFRDHRTLDAVGGPK